MVGGTGASCRSVAKATPALSTADWEYNFTLILTILAIGGEVKLCLSSITRQDGEVEDTHGYFNDASDLVMMETA